MCGSGKLRGVARQQRA